MLSYNRFIIISWYSITIRSTYRNNWKLNDIWNRLQIFIDNTEISLKLVSITQVFQRVEPRFSSVQSNELH